MALHEPITMIAVKIGLDMGIFSDLGDEKKSCKQLAESFGGDALLVGRILRLLAAQDILQEVDTDAYVNTEFSRSLMDPDGIRNGFRYFYDLGLPQPAKLPEYLRETGYKNADDYDHPPFEYIMRPDVECGNFWVGVATAVPHS